MLNVVCMRAADEEEEEEEGRVEEEEVGEDEDKGRVEERAGVGSERDGSGGGASFKTLHCSLRFERVRKPSPAIS